jgi:hypothetical protein
MMSESLRRRLALTGLCLLLAFGLASLAADTQACPANEIEDYYFSDASHSTLVGYCILQCDCYGRGCWGSITAYRERYSYPCD